MTPSQKHIGKYAIEEELGRGGFAVVYRARDVELDRLVALKVLRPALSDDPDFVARFKQEARAAAGLHHPNIVTVYDAAQIDEQLIIAMQYVEGRTLRDELAQGPLPFDRAVTILEQIASALDYAHQRGIVHRDVKPANILLEETSHGIHATLLDFGLAKAMEARTALTSQGTLLGSPEYMAPEQSDPDRAREIGPATDRYALGVVAYQLLTGRVPFPGNTPATLNAHLNLKPPEPRALRSEVSPQVSAVLLKMLAKAPADRYGSASEFVQALQSALTPAIHPVKAKSSRWLRAVLAGALVVLALGIVGYVVGTQLIQPPASPRATVTGALTLTPAATPVSPATLTAGNMQTRTVDGMTMVYVPGGMFKMGSTQGEDNEKPIHDVTLDGFWIDRTEVTNAQYTRCVAAKQCATPADTNSITRPYFGNPQFDEYPVIHVTWEHANQYCTWAGGGLPTEAQWEYAARGPQGNTYPWGSEPPSDARLNYRGAIGDTQPVGAYPEGASWVGALDLAGNVTEWVNDRYGLYPDSSQTNPSGPTVGQHRVLRGGAWLSDATLVRATARGGIPADSSSNSVGFRCAMAQAPAAAEASAPVSAGSVTPTPSTGSTPGLGSTRTRTIDGMTMVYVPGGTFKMGSDQGNDDEKPMHDVTLDSFWIDRMEVTNAQYAQCVLTGKCVAPSEKRSYAHDLYFGNIEYAHYPVVFVSWQEADQYCNWAGGQLPTEAQWEYAARGQEANIYPWGSEMPNDTRLNYHGSIGDTQPVGSFVDGASWVGALDLSGNVSEWVQDWYGPYSSSPQVNPHGSPSGYNKVSRGGYWDTQADFVRSAVRKDNRPDLQWFGLGFRCAVATGK